MRILRVFAVMALLALPGVIGCREGKEEMDKYGEAVMTLPERAKVLSDLTRIRRALDLYKVDHEGVYPGSISELGLDKLYYADEYEYDSSTGKVRSKNYPTL